MLLITKTYKVVITTFIVLVLSGCIASPKPQATDLSKLNKLKKVELVKKDFSGTDVLETDFEIIHNEQDIKNIQKELLSLQKKDNSDYVIGSGDMFNIFVYEEPELNVKGSVVKVDGTLTFQLIGDVKIAGLTINKAMEKIANKLKRYLVNPIVSIIPVEFRSKSFTILGKVSQPGTYQITNNTKVIDSIALAEGLSIGIFEDNTIELADLEHAFIRRGRKVLPVNFIELVRKGNPLHNVPLKDKDYIYIPSALNTEVYILGQVNLPGHYGFKERMTLSQLVTYAKGFKINANLQKVAIIRGTLSRPTVYVANLQDIFEGKSKDFKIKPFDIVYIPTSTLGDWNNILSMIMPSLETIQSAYITNQLVR